MIMEFSNEQISLHDLPQISRVTFTSLHERFAAVRLGALLAIYSILLSVGTLVFLFVPGVKEFLSSFPGAGLLIAAPILMILRAWFVYASTKAIHYSIRQHDVILQSGVFWKKEVTQPLKRIQHVELTRGPIDKRFGLANVRLFSAGTARSTFKIPGVEFQIAAQIKQYVLEYKDQSVTETIDKAVTETTKTVGEDGLDELAT